MQARAKTLHDHYFKPKPKFHFRLYDSDKELPAPDGTDQARLEIDSIDVYVNLVV